jgi:hypothetical protein
MIPDSTHLDSINSLPSLVSVETIDGTSLPVVSHVTLHTPQFHVPSVSHVP